MINNHLFNINIRANFLSGGRYSYSGKIFTRNFAKTPQSLHDYIMNNQNLFINFFKSKRDRNKKLIIRKNDNYNFLKNFTLNDIYCPKSNYDYNHDKVYITDCGIITLREWISFNEEYVI